MEGEVVDGVCFSNGLGGASHRSCAEACFARGEAAIFVTADGTGWVLYSDHGNESLLHEAKASAGTRVRITGHLRERGGLKGISLTKVDGRPAM